MIDDQFRQMVRNGLAPLVEYVPEGPEWDDLIADDIVMAAPPPPQRASGWLVGLGVSVAVLVLVGLAVVLSPSAPPPTTAPEQTVSPTTIALDGTAAAREVEVWWSLVIAGNVEAAVEMSHPDGQFNFEGLSELILSLGGAVEPAAEARTFGPDQQPMVCYALTGIDAEVSGAAVFRQHEGQWLIWEVRPRTVGCVAHSSSTTTLPSAGFEMPPVLDQPTGSRVYFRNGQPTH